MKKNIWVLLILTFGCKEPFNAPVPAAPVGYLVVEGYINPAGETDIHLSRTSKISETHAVDETGAVVQVVGEDNSVSPLLEQLNGTYAAPSLLLDPNIKYKLSIKTSDAKEYESTFVTVKQTPPLDSISWTYNDDGLRIFVNAHGPANGTRYYAWSYVETWEFQSAFRASLKFGTSPGPGPIPIAFLEYANSTQTADESIFTCWKTDASSAINLGSTVKLADDVVYSQIIFYPRQSWQLSRLYSVNVVQNSVSRDTYEFLEKMKKNSENLGTLFDPLPSDIKGNITCLTDPSEPVVGIVDISAPQERRIFISNSQLPDWNFHDACKDNLYEILNDPDSIQKAYNNRLAPTVPNKLSLAGTIITFNAAAEICVDCTTRGSNSKPIFWP